MFIGNLWMGACSLLLVVKAGKQNEGMTYGNQRLERLKT